MHVLGRHLRPRVFVADGVPLDVDVGIAGVPAAGRLVDVTIEGDRDGAGLAGPDLDLPVMDAVLDAAGDHQLIRPGRHPGLVAAVHVERLPVRHRPEGAGSDPESPDLVGVAVHEDRVVRRQGHPAGRVEETDAGGHRTPRCGVGDLEADLADRRRRLGGAAPGNLDVAYGQALAAADGDVDPPGPLACQPRAVEGQRDAPQGCARFRLDLDLAPAVAAVLVPDDGERCSEGRRVGQGERDRFVDVEGVVVIDIESDQPADHALPAADRACLDLIAERARTQLRIAQPVGVRDARRDPVDLYYVAGLGPVGPHAGGRRHQRDDRGHERAHGQAATKRRLHLQLPSSHVAGSGTEAP